jgi:hypothetical protein
MVYAAPFGRLALYAYGSQEAHTEDVAAELAPDVEEVGAFPPLA